MGTPDRHMGAQLQGQINAKLPSNHSILPPSPATMSSETEPERMRNTVKPEDDERLEPLRFSPEEEASLVSESNNQKASANTRFTSGAYSEAIQGYEGALSACPNYLEYEVAVLRSNIAACHLKLADWKAAIAAATEALEALDRLDPPAKKSGGKEGEGAVEEVDEETADKIEALAKSGRTRDDVQKIRTKALLRRAKARLEMGGWAALQGADEGGYQDMATLAMRADAVQTTNNSPRCRTSHHWTGKASTQHYERCRHG